MECAYSGREQRAMPSRRANFNSERFRCATTDLSLSAGAKVPTVEEGECFERCVGDARDLHRSRVRAYERPQRGICGRLDVTVWVRNRLPVWVAAELIEGSLDLLEEAR